MIPETIFPIPLTQGQTAYVDREDYAELNQHRWCVYWDTHTRSFYAHRGLNGGCVSMHRQLLGPSKGDGWVVDHENHNTLDNRKSNLCVGTHRKNQANRKNKSQHGTGVYRAKGRYYAWIRIEGISRRLGTFGTPEEARVCREEFIRINDIS